MEFPDLGEHCSEESCKLLDFLPMKCDACEEIFCKDHITYTNHKCTSAYKKDVQVPVCPLCNTPIPIKRGEMPDIKVGNTLTETAEQTLASESQRYSNCPVLKLKGFHKQMLEGGCKQKEMIKVTCDQCHLNYCLKHRHPLDHDCTSDDHPVSKSGHAALMRTQAASSSSAGLFATRGTSRCVPNGLSGKARAQQTSAQRSLQAAVGPSPAPAPAPRVIPQSASLQANLSEEQALQRALELSLAESASSPQTALSPQEQEDLALAQALAASEEEFRRQQQRQQDRDSKQSNCSMS